ncbi:hypothetical protein [Bifidobacterium sp.]|uniref:hypothetical protein n=1 Tax=Bifidobacterium sp. TaxID=41200 RepID=UPI0039EB6EB2
MPIGNKPATAIDRTLMIEAIVFHRLKLALVCFIASPFSDEHESDSRSEFDMFDFGLVKAMFPPITLHHCSIKTSVTPNNRFFEKSTASPKLIVARFYIPFLFFTYSLSFLSGWASSVAS